MYREYENQGRSCDAVVREAEKELYDDNYILFLLYKACRDHYCLKNVSIPTEFHEQDFEFAEYSACRVVNYERTYQPDLKRELVNDVRTLLVFY